MTGHENRHDDQEAVVTGAFGPGSDGGADPTQMWVLIPAFNEASVIGDVVVRVLSLIPNVVVVDDGSDDETFAVAHSSGAHALRHPVNLGQGAALQTAIEYAAEQGAAYVGTLDGDDQHDVRDLLRMYREMIGSDLDVVLGSRFLGEAIGIPRSRKALLKAATVFTNLTTGVALTDAHNGLRVMRVSAALRLQVAHNRMAHASEIIRKIGKLGLRYRELPVSVRYTEYSLGKGQRLRDGVRILADLFAEFLSR